MTGTQLKLRGMQLSASKHKEALIRAKYCAKVLAEHTVLPISINDVREHYIIMGWKWDLWNAAGSIFKGGDWQWCGFINATHESGHSRMVRTWKLRNHS